MTDMYLSVSLEAEHDFDTDAVTRRLGVEPTQVRKLGTPIQPWHDALYKYSSWEWDSAHISADDAGALIEQSAVYLDRRFISFCAEIHAAILYDIRIAADYAEDDRRFR